MKVTNNCLGSKKSKSTDVDNATEFYLDSIDRCRDPFYLIYIIFLIN